MDAGRVLVVEDDPSIRLLARTVLEGRGYGVTEAGDGPSALEAARAARPDVVLLDIGLPGMDGFGVLGLLKDDEELVDVPVVMVTAWAEPELITKALDRGAHDHIRKPFEIGDLAARVDAAARGKARCADRDQMHTEVERALVAARRSGEPVSVIMLGVDHFSDVTDVHGEAVGGDLLLAAARRFSQRLRRSDVIGRWGDEQFVVLAPGSDIAAAATLAEDLRAALADRPVDTKAAALRVTASAGVAEWEGDTVAGLIARAGAALHESAPDAVECARLMPVAA